MIRFLILTASAFLGAGSLNADQSKLYSTNAFVAFGDQRGWQQRSEPIDHQTIETVRSAYNSTDPEAVKRLIKALESTYSGSEIGAMATSNGALHTTYLAVDDSIILVKFFLNTVRATEAEREDFFDLLEKVMGEKLGRPRDEVLTDVWAVAMDTNKRQFEHGWINLSSVNNRAMAWGVPPDFLEVVVTARADCEFLPVEGWMARQLCP